MSQTIVSLNPAYISMRAMVLRMLDQIEFRHHGIGVLQGYIQENCEPEVRIHIWSRLLLKPGMDVSGDVHDHRFDMVSHVLHGSVWHEELHETKDPAGTHGMMALTHARAAADTAYHGPTTLLEGRYSVLKIIYRIDAGWTYKFPARQFHHSPLPENPYEVAVTCIEKHRQQDVQARLLYPLAHEPVMAFGHTPDQKVVQEVLSIAKSNLREKQ